MANRWEGKGDQEVGKNKATGHVLVQVNPKFYRPTEVVCKVDLIVIVYNVTSTGIYRLVGLYWQKPYSRSTLAQTKTTDFM